MIRKRGAIDIDINIGDLTVNAIHTNGQNQDFILLCTMLDNALDEIVGGKKQREHYVQFNTLHDIHDVVVIYHKDIPIGCGGYKRYSTETAEIKRVFVRKDYRGKGISKVIMSLLENQARNDGYKSLILETGKPLTAAVNLYNIIGFTQIDNYGQYQGLESSICMKKELR